MVEGENLDETGEGAEPDGGVGEAPAAGLDGGAGEAPAAEPDGGAGEAPAAGLDGGAGEAPAAGQVPPGPDQAAEAGRAGGLEAGGEAEPESEWQEKTRLAWRLWQAGDNAALRPLVAELDKAPEGETEARQAARELGRRLRLDPVAIGLWVLSLLAFAAITYLFVLR